MQLRKKNHIRGDYCIKKLQSKFKFNIVNKKTKKHNYQNHESTCKENLIKNINFYFVKSMRKKITSNVISIPINHKLMDVLKRKYKLSSKYQFSDKLVNEFSLKMKNYNDEHGGYYITYVQFKIDNPKEAKFKERDLIVQTIQSTPRIKVRVGVDSFKQANLNAANINLTPLNIDEYY